MASMSTFSTKLLNFFWLQMLVGKLVLRRAHPSSTDGNVSRVEEIAHCFQFGLLSARWAALWPCASWHPDLNAFPCFKGVKDSNLNDT